MAEAKTILIVDDDLQVLHSLEKLFTKQGYHVVVAQNPVLALEEIERSNFNLVIIDIRLPQLNGVETVRRIRSMSREQKKADIPVVFITGYSDMDVHEETSHYGKLVKKPFDLDFFLGVVREAIAQRRVVVTGIGVIAPNGIGKDAFWEANVAGRSGICPLTHFDTSLLESKIAGAIYSFLPEQFLDPLAVRRTDRFVHLGLAAAKLALSDARLDCASLDQQRIGTIIGSGLGGCIFHEEQIELAYVKGYNRLHPLAVPKITPNALPGHISIEFGLKGPAMAISTACASSTNAIGEAYRKIRNNEIDAALTGGAEAPLTPVTFSAYCALRVLSKRNDAPKEASRPFDKTRDGFVIAEGAAILVLELLEHALKRGAHIYAEIIGYAANSGAHHMVMPLEDGSDVAQLIKKTLDDARIEPTDIDYINAHGTSTHLNDKAETNAIKIAFGGYAYQVPISSTKSMTGHSIGASGAIEAAACSLAIHHGIIPPTINYRYKDPECDLDYVPNESRRKELEYVLSNSFGFGSANACLVFKKFR
jgi:3-oxoacyl-[acyl-carrier-protein] synthase II